MTTLAIISFWVLVGSITIQSAMTLAFVRVLRRRRPELLPDDACPKAVVILCLRGPDPFLRTCVQALLSQDYPRYDVRVVVDARSDPAWTQVEEALATYPATNLSIEPLTQRRDTCSLKCSSLVQAIASLDNSYEVVALLDADTIPHPTWLRELVTPLADPGVGASTGNRWYMPVAVSWANLLRYVWNAAAIVQMYWYGIPWGGTLALKRQVFRQSQLLERWGHAMCEDTMLYRELRKQGLRVAFVPSLMMVNRETCPMGGFLRWLTRQLLMARLYHPGWPAVVLHGFGTPLLQAAGLILLTLAVASRDWAAVAWLGGGVMLYFGAWPWLIAALEGGVRTVVSRRGATTAWLSLAAVIQLGPTMLFTQLLYPFCLLQALTLRTVEWRGIHYQIDGSWKIRLLEYQPYRGEAAAGARPDSL